MLRWDVLMMYLNKFRTWIGHNTPMCNISDKFRTVNLKRDVPSELIYRFLYFGELLLHCFSWIYSHDVLVIGHFVFQGVGIRLWRKRKSSLITGHNKMDPIISWGYRWSQIIKIDLLGIGLTFSGDIHICLIIGLWHYMNQSLSDWCALECINSVFFCVFL